MTPEPELWIPGPTQVRPERLRGGARPAIGHRTQDMVALIERIDPHLRTAFGLAEGSDAHVCVHTCSGSGLMEMALLGVGRRVLSVVNGAFSERWAKVGESLGREVHRVEVPWGRSVEPADLARALEEHGPFDAMTLVVNETSTGVRTPLGPIAEVRRRFPDVLLLCDVVSYLAGAPVDFDANGLDFALAGVQKALALPPGIAVLACSDRFMHSARKQERRGFYLDPVQTIEGHEQRKTPATPCTPLYFALARQLEDITSGATLPERDRGRSGADAWRARYEKHERMLAQTTAWAANHGLAPLPIPADRSPLVSCLRAGQVDVSALVSGLKRRGFQISNGYGALKGETFRIGHMGDHTEQGLAALLAAADAELSVRAR